MVADFTAHIRPHQSITDSNAEFLYIDREKNFVSGRVACYGFVDGDTKQYMLAIPSLNISGYGDTEEKAETMMRFCAQDSARYLLQMSADEMQAELSGLGWLAEKNSPKELTKLAVDEAAEFENIHIEGGKIERFNLALAA